jgi:alpha-1,3-rhamnosyltransferase
MTLKGASNDGSGIFVVVPSYNLAPFIEKCVLSIIGQTVSPKKLLVIDDGSTDGSPGLIARLLKDCPFDSELIARENRGLCATLNQAFSLSSGKYFAYLGADDMWLAGFLEQRRQLMESREDAALAYGHTYIINEHDEIIESTTDYPGEYPEGNMKELLPQGIAPMSSTIFYRRSALEGLSWNESSRLEDYEMYLKLMDRGEFVFDPQILSAWRTHGYNTGKNSRMMVHEMIEAQNRNAHLLGVDTAELAAIQNRIRFVYARDMLQHGDKSGAASLARTSWRGARSGIELLKFTLRMAVPMSVVNAKRRRSTGQRTKLQDLDQQRPENSR